MRSHLYSHWLCENNSVYTKDRKSVYSYRIGLWRKLSQQIGSNYNKTSNNELIRTSDIKVIQVQKTDPGILFVKTTYEQEEFAHINVNNTRRKQESISTIKCVAAYKKKMDVSDIKKTHIEYLLLAKSIPTLNKPIYDSIFT